jgi:hypothetical protein
MVAIALQKKDNMGLFWDLYQQSQISQQGERAAGLETRVAMLESELHRTQELLREVIGRLERHVGQDLDADGRVG